MRICESKTNLIEDSLKELCELDYHIVHRYEMAINKLEMEELLPKLFEFESDHHSHIQIISKFLKQHCKAIPSNHFIEQSLRTNQKMVNQSNETEILSLIRESEINMLLAYQEIIGQTGAIVGLQDFLLQALQDELRHKRWLDRLLK